MSRRNEGEKKKLTTNRRKKDLNVGSRNQLGVHSVGHAKDRMTELGLGSVEATCDFREVPNGFDSSLGANRLTRRKEDFAICHQTASLDGFAAFGKIDVGFGDSNGRANVPKIEKWKRKRRI